MCVRLKHNFSFLLSGYSSPSSAALVSLFHYILLYFFGMFLVCKWRRNREEEKRERDELVRWRCGSGRKKENLKREKRLSLLVERCLLLVSTSTVGSTLFSAHFPNLSVTLFPQNLHRILYSSFVSATKQKVWLWICMCNCDWPKSETTYLRR